MNQAKLQEVFSDKAYVESILKMSAEDAAKSLQEKGVEVTAEDLIKALDFAKAHKEEFEKEELSEEMLSDVAGGVSTGEAVGYTILTVLSVGSVVLAATLW